MSEFNSALRAGFVKFGDDFDTAAEVTHLWGLTAKKLPSRVRFNVPGKDDTVVLMLSENGGDGWTNLPCRGANVDGRGWKQIVRIDETNSDSERSREHAEAELKKPLKRYVFWRETRDGASWYKFHGVFKIDVEATRASLKKEENACIYEKIADGAECLKAVEADGEIPESGVGRKVESVLMDRVGDGGRILIWPRLRFLVKEVLPDGVKLVRVGTKAEILVPRRDFELGYFRFLPENCCTSPEISEEDRRNFEEFWKDFTGWWGIAGDEEEMTFEKSGTDCKIRCRWDEDTCLVAMISPWAGEWDYVQMYRGMFGWGDVEEGFHDPSERMKAAELLLDEIIRRREWLEENPDAAVRMKGEVRAEFARRKSAAGDGQGSNARLWFEEYRWTRNQMAGLGEGDMRLYVKGVNRLFGVPIHCEWAIADM